MKKIMFSDKYGLTQAVLDGRKTMTRRIIGSRLMKDAFAFFDRGEGFVDDYLIAHASYKVGEEVAIAQSYGSFLELYDTKYSEKSNNMGWSDHLCMHVINTKGYYNKMYVRAELMPRRIRITSIKVERLQDVYEEDCLREGIETWMGGYIVTGIIERGYKSNIYFDNPRDAFAFLIDKISGKGTWEKNPFVFAYEFELIK